ncbi:hypothetical protein [Allorhodopirellula solitaria]|uniref:Uncharacterized protein n=1 Tax=Allorhodopirellula solitaria TaxID=2527987 RepID=A0A5C5X0Q9_9BACT|nr:hypothetical protein [Allorhodopirellula solitaria]TWT56536.1 hypothetical protein CA85_40690 [Allorhodopirellula solitaria]
MTDLTNSQQWWRDQLAKSLNGGILTTIALGSWVLAAMGEIDRYYLFEANVPENCDGDQYSDLWRSWGLLVLGSVGISAWSGTCIWMRRTKLPRTTGHVFSTNMVQKTCFSIAFAFQSIVVALVGFDATKTEGNPVLREFPCLIVTILLAYSPLLVVAWASRNWRFDEEESRESESDR